MSEEMIVRLCSPTLAGIKIANMFNCDCSSPAELRRTVRTLNQRLFHKGLLIIPVKFFENKALIYVFRPKLLNEYLKNDEVRRILDLRGYDTNNMNSCMRLIISRLQRDSFPHEIGIFLGYPPEDVQGFIDNKGKNFKICGHWKTERGKYHEQNSSRFLERHRQHGEDGGCRHRRDQIGRRRRRDRSCR